MDDVEYVPTYEDKDSDWMLVGDVPWKIMQAYPFDEMLRGCNLSLRIKGFFHFNGMMKPETPVDEMVFKWLL
ncbi:hypothetical protein F3Y22_tig00111356pilonHSYRG00086 [Hibiscus syriacus]|uniref:Auxin-responsive protein n=1 Tax=Hibiscus syriacus TaxID=106335 RepID=A0A6A2YNP8_HIBSY|nr:hypothetical protein F3Y22_tig00111356pilonHSYRG00086 [Hibiscus syriacus]